METVLFAAFAAGQLKAVAGVFAEDTDVLTRNKTAGDKAEPEKIADPFGILGIILVAFYGFNPLRVGNGDIDPVFRRLKTGIQYFPVDSMQTSKQELSRSHCLKCRISLLKVEKRFFW